MRRLITTLAVFGAVVALTGALSAQTATTAKKATGTQATAQKTASEPTYTGTIEKYDSNEKVLTLKHKSSDLQFEMASDCTISEGATKLTASDLSGLVGQFAKIYYTGAPGSKMEAHKIVVEKAKAEKTMAKKDETKPAKK